MNIANQATLGEDNDMQTYKTLCLKHHSKWLFFTNNNELATKVCLQKELQSTS